MKPCMDSMYRSQNIFLPINAWHQRCRRRWHRRQYAAYGAFAIRHYGSGAQPLSYDWIGLPHRLYVRVPGKEAGGIIFRLQRGAAPIIDAV